MQMYRLIGTILNTDKTSTIGGHGTVPVRDELAQLIVRRGGRYVRPCAAFSRGSLMDSLEQMRRIDRDSRGEYSSKSMGRLLFMWYANKEAGVWFVGNSKDRARTFDQQTKSFAGRGANEIYQNITHTCSCIDIQHTNFRSRALNDESMFFFH